MQHVDFLRRIGTLLVCRPLMNVCDRYGSVRDLVHHLLSEGSFQCIQEYAWACPSRAPSVVGALLDERAPTDFITGLLFPMRWIIPVEQLCYEVCGSIKF